MDGQNDYYAYQVIYSPDDEEFVGLCGEFPSLSWLDKSPEKALEGIQKVVSEVVADMLENHEDIPEPFGERQFNRSALLQETTF